MKLSEAIRKGAAMHPIEINYWFDLVDTRKGLELGTCVLGAAYEGFFGRINIENGDRIPDPEKAMKSLRRAFPPLRDRHARRRAKCRFCDHHFHGNERLTEYLMHLNDVHEMPRTEIADFLEQVGL